MASVDQPFHWLGRDARIISTARGLRTFGQSTVVILLALYLHALGLTLLQIGAVLSVDVAGTALLAVGVTLATGKTGRRRMLVALMLLSAAASATVGLTHSFPVLVAAIFLGNFTAGAGAGGPLQPLELASLAEVAPPQRRTQLLALNAIIAALTTALGSLAAGLPVVMGRSFSLGEVDAYRALFGLYALLQLVSALLYSRLSPAIEGAVAGRRWTNPLRLKSRRRIFTLTALFSMDHFAGSLIVQSLVAYWFATRFGISLGSLSVVFFFSSVLTALSLWAAAKIADRIGLLNTMVFTHIPSSLFLIAAAFSPVAWMAVTFWQLRALLGQMDVPTRDSYTMAVVEPDERVAMAGIHGVGRSLAGVIGPSLGTALWNAVAASVPFVACGVLKIGYDLALYAMFRKVKPPEEAQASAAGGPGPGP